MKNRLILLVLCVFCLPYLFSGYSKEKPSAAMVAGTYMFKHADERVETWVINTDFTFDQQFFQTVTDYTENRPFLTYKNDWLFESGTAIPALDFQRSYAIYNYGG